MNFEAFKDLTRIEQTLFNLPFILAGALLSWNGFNPGFFWILPAFLTARISGMAFNQLIDYKIDASNPRTKHRAIPTGRVSPRQANIVAWGALILFLIICFQINLLCMILAPFAALLLFAYSYFKRFHASCHFVMGLIYFLGPIMASAAMTGRLSWAPVFLGCVALFSISAADIVYAMQDIEFDCVKGLHSIPSRFGIQKSLFISRLLHVICIFFVILMGIVAHFPLFYYVAALIIGGVFIHFHSTILTHYQNTGTVRGIESVFFFVNVTISATIFLFILLSVLWRVLL